MTHQNNYIVGDKKIGFKGYPSIWMGGPDSTNYKPQKSSMEGARVIKSPPSSSFSACKGCSCIGPFLGGHMFLKCNLLSLPGFDIFQCSQPALGGLCHLRFVSLMFFVFFDKTVLILFVLL